MCTLSNNVIKRQLAVVLKLIVRMNVNSIQHCIYFEVMQILLVHAM